MADLGGRVVACLEARQATEIADLVTRHRGIAYPAPCLREVHQPDADHTRRAVDVLCDDKIDAAVFLTGVGVQTLVDCARLVSREYELLASLAAKRIAARGPKAHHALRRAGVRVDLLAPAPFTSEALLETIAREWDLLDQTVVVQLYGRPVPVFVGGLARLGAHVVEVAPYRWERPLDEEAVVRLTEDMADGWIDILAATNAGQVQHLFGIARDRGLEPSLRRGFDMPRLLVAAQGIVCAAAFQNEGIGVDVISPRASMGSLVQEMAEHVGRQPTAPEPQAPASEGIVAVLIAGDLGSDDMPAVVGQLSLAASVGVLADRGRVDRMVERAAAQHGLGVQSLPPGRDGRQGADELVRRADRVLIVARDGVKIGRLLQVAERYAKPVRVLRLAAKPTQPPRV